MPREKRSKSKAMYHVGSGSGHGQNPGQPAGSKAKVVGDSLTQLQPEEKRKRKQKAILDSSTQLRLKDEKEEGNKVRKPRIFGDLAHMVNRFVSLKEVIAMQKSREEERQRKAVADSLTELQLEEKEEEEEEEEEEKKERNCFSSCDICSKEDHWTVMCPWKKLVPEGENVGPGYEVVCRCCDQLGGHPGVKWTGRAIIALCGFCGAIGKHRTLDCPKYLKRKI